MSSVSIPLARTLVLISGIVATSFSALGADGKAVYEKTCVACHATGVANAPKLGDKAAWAPRLSAPTAALVASVIKGKGAMPPKAGVADLSEADIKAAVEFIAAAAR